MEVSKNFLFVNCRCRILDKSIRNVGALEDSSSTVVRTPGMGVLRLYRCFWLVLCLFMCDLSTEGLIIGFGVPPIRRSLGYKPVDDPPRTYPYPEKRPYPSGYSDEAPTVR